MISFQPIKIKEIGDVITGRTPKTDTEDNYGDDYMFIGPTDLHDCFKIEKSEKMISAQGLKSIKSSTIDGISICVGCIGWDMGNVGLVMEKCATNQQINSITNIQDNSYNPFYIYYWLKEKKQFLFDQANVTRTPILNKTDFSNIEINLPEKPYQDKVAHFLKLLDDKIIINNKINTTLENMIKQIYDLWFVQFDFPDKDGEPYKSSGGKMIYNENLKRDIPYGWEVQDFGYNHEIYRGELITNKTKKKGTIKVVSSGFSFSYFHNKANRSANIITVSASGNAGHVNFWREAIFASDCVTVQGESVAKTLLAFQFLKTIQKYLYSLASGSVQHHVYPSDLINLKYLNPPMSLVDLFEHKVIAANNLIGFNNSENDQLKYLRNWLLPMLMNGQVTVSEVS